MDAMSEDRVRAPGGASAVPRGRDAVIGAGVSGRAATRAFRARGHEVTALGRAHDLRGVREPSRSRPGARTEMREAIEAGPRRRRAGRPVAEIHGGLWAAPQHVDGLIADVGATVRRRDPIAGNLAPPDGGACARLLASAAPREVTSA